MSDQTDPRKLGLAAGQSGGKFGFMSIAISEEGAKDFGKGVESMAATSKLGGYGMMAGMLMKVIETSPAAELFSGFFEMFTSKMWAQVDWDAILTLMEKFGPYLDWAAEKIGTVLNVALEETGEKAKNLGTSLTALWGWMEDLDEAYSSWKDDLGEGSVWTMIVEFIEYLSTSGVLDGLGSMDLTPQLDTIVSLDVAFGDLGNSMSTMSTLLDGIRFGPIGDDDDDDDEDEDWYDPWDLL